MQTLNSKQVIAREVKSAMGRYGFTQKELAGVLGLTTSGMSDKFTGKASFSIDDLLTIAGKFGLSLEELLGPSFTQSRIPTPEYTEEKGRKKVVPVGFVPTGTTYQIVASSEKELASVGPAGLEPATKGL